MALLPDTCQDTVKLSISNRAGAKSGLWREIPTAAGHGSRLTQHGETGPHAIRSQFEALSHGMHQSTAQYIYLEQYADQNESGSHSVGPISAGFCSWFP